MQLTLNSASGSENTVNSDCTLTMRKCDNHGFNERALKTFEARFVD